MSDFVLQNTQNVTATLGAVDALGNPVALVPDAGSVVATASDPGALAVSVSPDQLTISIKALGPLIVGDVVTVSASVNGVALTPATVAADVVPSPPVALTLTLGAPVAN